MTDLNRMLAAKIMEWEFHEAGSHEYYGGEFYTYQEDGKQQTWFAWHPLSDESQAWQCLDKAMERGMIAGYDLDHYNEKDNFNITLYRPDPDYCAILCDADGTTRAEAIVHALAKLVEEE